MKIKQLPPDVINKIAAGEVVERPASVLKELVENALDAQAKKIDIFVEKGGKRLIKVKDDGTGIEPEDIPLAVQRFTTSKISSIDDLFDLETYGFRGEALSSISAVSKFKLTSRTINHSVGHEIYIEGGKLQYFRETGSPIGTTVEVADLFFNVPARKKFLKSERTELVHILDVFAKFAFIHTDKHFSITIDNKLLYNFYPSTLKERLKQIFGSDIEKNLIEVDYEGAIGTIKGYILPKGAGSKRYIFINNRPVRNYIIQQTLTDIIGKDSFYILFFELPSYFVDFNVHPSKQEVKFVKESSVVRLIKAALEESLNVFKKKTVSYQTEKKQVENQTLRQQTSVYQTETKFEVIGQVEDTFLIVYFNGDVYFIDQHVAHERIFYELLLQEYYEKKQIPIQKLLTPIFLPLSPDEIQRLKILQAKLKTIGFEFEIDKNKVYLTGIPFNMSSKSAEEAVLAILEKGNLNIPVEDMIAQVSCRMSVKAGNKLDKEKAYALIETWLKTNNPNLCPHGRPIYYKVSLDEVKRYVGRK